MKTLVDIPPGKIHNGWIWMWPAVGNFCTDYITRATVVRWGLNANTLEEAVCRLPSRQRKQATDG